MNENVEKPEIDILIELDLTKIKPKLRRKLKKQIVNKKLIAIVNIDVFGLEEGSLDMYSEVIGVTKKRKKNKKK
jgi:hypothetical protein